MPAVLVEDVSRHFGDVVAVDRVNLSIERGEFVTLLGPSGCGKTTTLRMVAGLEQNTGGRISIADRVVSDAAAGFFVPPDHRQLGMVFQSYAIWPHMTVFDNVAYPLRIRRRPKAEISDRVRAVLRLVEMEAFADRPAPALSGGQQQRVAIARALVFEPEVLLLDEPLSNLDARLRTQMGDEFRALQKRLGITSLGITGRNWTGQCLAGEPFSEGEPVLVLVRPENVHIAANGGTSMAWSGRIKSAIFRGPRQSIVVDASGLALNVEAPALLGANVGDQVHLNVSPAGAWAIRPDRASSATA